MMAELWKSKAARIGHLFLRVSSKMAVVVFFFFFSLTIISVIWCLTASKLRIGVFQALAMVRLAAAKRYASCCSRRRNVSIGLQRALYGFLLTYK